jgi:hypothetical protein
VPPQIGEIVSGDSAPGFSASCRRRSCSCSPIMAEMIFARSAGK